MNVSKCINHLLEAKLSNLLGAKLSNLLGAKLSNPILVLEDV